MVRAQDNSNQKAYTILRGVFDATTRIESGEVKIYRKTVNEGVIDTDDECYLAFDFQRGQQRFDVSCKDGVSLTLLTPEFYYHRTDRNATKLEKIAVATPVIRTTSHTVSPPDFVKPFDIRMIGLFIPYGPFWADSYKDTQTALLARTADLTDFKESTNGLVNIVFEAKAHENQPPPTRTTFVVDKRNGFTLVSKEDFAFGKISNKCEVSWSLQNRVWVPRSFVFSSNQGLSAEWRFEWKSVNKSFPKDFFSPDHLSDDAVELFSQEIQGETIRIGTVGENADGYIDRKGEKRVLARTILMGLGILLIAIGLGKKVYDWRTRPSE